MKPSLAIVFLLATSLCGADEQTELSEQKLFSYVVTVAKSYGVTASEEEVARIQLSVKIKEVLRRFTTDQLLEASKRMDPYSLTGLGLKGNILPPLSDVRLSDTEYENFCQTLNDLKRKWEALPVPSVENAAGLGRSLIQELDGALAAAKQRRDFRATFAALNKARDNLTLVIVMFPLADLKFVTPTQALVDDLLRASEPQNMHESGSPFLPFSGPDPTVPWSDDVHLNWARLKVLQDGCLIYICNGKTILAGIVFSDSQIRYFRDIKGTMPVALFCWSNELLKLLQEK